MSNELIIKADCITAVSEGMLLHLTLVNPTDLTVKRLQRLEAWQSFEAVALADVGEDGNPLTVMLEPHWFIDCHKANSKANVMVVRFVRRSALGVEPSTSITTLSNVPPTRVLQASFGASEAEIDAASEFNVAELALSAVSLSAYIREEEDGSVYFRYDLEGRNTQENDCRCTDIIEDLRSVGYQIDDLQIEHDCISGTLIPMETEK